MKKTVLCAFLFMPAFYSYAQINALTETGEEVILYDDGTWVYANPSDADPNPIKENVIEFKKDKNSTFLVKSNTVNVGIWLNPKEWSFEKTKGDDVAEYEFSKKGEDLYAMIISEKIEIPIETLKEVAFENARSVAPDTRIVQEEFRNVNGHRVLMMQMLGTVQGIRFMYFGYYYSNSKGSVQLLAYTSQNLFEGYSADIEQLLNGFVVME